MLAKLLLQVSNMSLKKKKLKKKRVRNDHEYIEKGIRTN
jgi:hypothetical protein